MNPRLRLKIVVVGIIVGIAIVSAGYFFKRKTWEVKIATGPKGGMFYPVGRRLEPILKEHTGKRIQETEAIPTEGSVENLKRLLSPKEDRKGDIGFVFGPAITDETVPQARRSEIRMLASLYRDFVQIVVRRGANINNLTDLRGMEVYLGAADGVRNVAEEMLKAVGLDLQCITEVEAANPNEACNKLIAGELKAAFFVMGIPADAVKRALKDGKYKLLDLGNSRDQIIARMRGLTEAVIPPNTYGNQTMPVRTVSGKTLLLCREDLEVDLVSLIEEALFDDIDKLLRAQEIRLQNAFNTEGLPTGIELHPGAKRFKAKMDRELHIVTGTINGKYWELGKKIQSLLEQRGMRSWVIHTDGSVENVEWLKRASLHKGAPSLAIMQYDIALASHSGTPNLIYQTSPLDPIDFPEELNDLRRIATLHQEKVHIIMRKSVFGETEKQPTTIEDLTDNWDGLSVSLGPKLSGTRVLAQVILTHHKLLPSNPEFLSVPEMINRISAEESSIDVGFFVGHVPSEALKTLFASDEIRLLSIGQREMVNLVGQVFHKERIEPGTYKYKPKEIRAVETIATTAVLVTTEDLPFNVKKITEAIFRGADVIGLKVEEMAKDLAIPLHLDAKAHYREAGYPGYLPPKSFFDLLSDTWRSLTVIIIFLGGYKGTLEFKRNATSKKMRRRIHSVNIEASYPDSVDELLEIRRDVRDCVRNKWWHPEELDSSRWGELENLIDRTIEEARQNMTRELLVEIRAVRENDLERLELYLAFEKRIWRRLERGELEESQHGFLLAVTQEGIQHASGTSDTDHHPEN
ncbi:TAXI family TRAP transporter solute-binding subunit [Candidatus Poribacteria bacterium]|nr:TAXI family TRAP transporter solute-binding subunit [Candidatus Poribacteria bacterium]